MAAGAVMFYVMTERVGRLKHFPGGENAAVSTATGAAAAPADSSLAVASHRIWMAADGRSAGGHRQIARIRTRRIVLEGIYRAARRSVGAGRAAGREGRICFHCVRTIPEIRRFDNGQAATPDRRGARLSGGGRARRGPLAPGIFHVSNYGAAFLRWRLCLARKLRPRRFASLRMRSSQLAPARFLFSAKNGSSAPATSPTLFSCEISGQ